MNHLPLIRKNLCKKELLHQAELILVSKPSQTKSTELNIRLLEQNAKRKMLHQAELILASKCGGGSSALLNSRLADKATHAKRLHSAQIFSMTR